MKWINSILFSFSLLFSFFFLKNHSNNSIFHGDALGYYIYLPATFIYHNATNLDSSATDNPTPEIMKGYIERGSYDNPKTPLGKSIIQYTIGTAILESPAFFAAQLYCITTHTKDDGFGKPFENAVRILNWIYTILGLVLTYFSLIEFYSKQLSWLVCNIIFIGTNLFYFTVYQNGMSHVPMFFCYALLINLSINLVQKNNVLHYSIVGVLLGLMFITRPTDVVALFIPLFILTNSMKEFATRLKLNFTKWLLSIAFFMLPVIPQMLYWKAISGSYIYYSYGNQGFNFLKPHIINGLLFPSNGWLQYTPVMILAIIGFFFFKKNKALGFANPIIFLLYSYLIYSWFCYQYINGLGSRPMIHLYPLFAFSIAAFLSFLNEKKMLWRILSSIIIAFFIYVNLVFSVQQVNGKLWSEFSSFLFNAKSLYKFDLTYNSLVELDVEENQPELNQIKLVSVLEQNNFNDSIVNTNIIKLDSVNYCYQINKGNIFSPIYIVKNFNPKDFENVDYIKLSADCMSPNALPTIYWASNLVFQIERDNKQIYYKACKIENKLGVQERLNHNEKINLFTFTTNYWDNVSFYIPYPLYIDLKPNDKLRVFITTQPSTELQIDNIKLELFELKK
jgi:hypothetical protein